MAIDVTLSGPAVVEPGDTVLLTTDRDITAAQARTLKDALAEKIPGVNVVIISAASALVVKGTRE